MPRPGYHYLIAMPSSVAVVLHIIKTDAWQKIDAALSGQPGIAVGPGLTKKSEGRIETDVRTPISTIPTSRTN